MKIIYSTVHMRAYSPSEGKVVEEVAKLVTQHASSILSKTPDLTKTGFSIGASFGVSVFGPVGGAFFGGFGATVGTIIWAMQQK